MTLLEATPLETTQTEWIPPPTEALTNLGWQDTGRETWWTSAACRELPEAADLFFSEEIPDIAEAKSICAGCTAIGSCLEGAIRRSEPCGVWGGQLFLNGRIIAQKRRRGRPPKNPRPEDQVPMLPIPDHLLKLIA